jgi:Coenzyme PQQ synthesis protein D (PqqD)
VRWQLSPHFCPAGGRGGDEEIAGTAASRYTILCSRQFEWRIFADHPRHRIDISEAEAPYLKTLLSLNSVVVASKQQVSCLLGEESAILNMKNSVYYGMDPVGTRVWHLLQQPRSVREVCDAILGEYEVDRPRCEQDLLELLADMHAEGLIEKDEIRKQ